MLTEPVCQLAPVEHTLKCCCKPTATSQSTSMPLSLQSQHGCASMRAAECRRTTNSSHLCPPPPLGIRHSSSGTWRHLPVVQMRARAASSDTVLPAPSAPERTTNGASAASSQEGEVTHTATLLVQCPDAKGVVAALSQLLYGFGCNIVSSDQFSERDTQMFFQRITFDFSDMVIGTGNTPILERAVNELAARFNMKWKISYRNKLKRVALLVSKLDHCLYDLLIRHRSGELKCEIPLVISNHPDLSNIADMFGVPFHCVPMHSKTDKPAQEAAIDALIEQHNIDTIILARYMQIFSKDFCERHWEHTINIHHSFLPAFEGAKPYHRAHERGVKIIGATAHYATSELDAGPIIDQHTSRITHRDSVEDMVRKGRDLERLVLARAVRWHLDDRVLVYGNKTVVFED